MMGSDLTYLRINSLQNPGLSYSCFAYLHNENITSFFSIGETTFILGKASWGGGYIVNLLYCL